MRAPARMSGKGRRGLGQLLDPHFLGLSDGAVDGSHRLIDPSPGEYLMIDIWARWQSLIDPSPEPMIDNWAGTRYKGLPVPDKESILKLARVTRW